MNGRMIRDLECLSNGNREGKKVEIRKTNFKEQSLHIRKRTV